MVTCKQIICSEKHFKNCRLVMQTNNRCTRIKRWNVMERKIMTDLIDELKADEQVVHWHEINENTAKTSIISQQVAER